MTALENARNRVHMPRIGKSLVREMDRDISAMRDLIEYAERADAALVTVRDLGHAVLAVNDSANQIGTHYEDCHLRHRDCLAVAVIHRAEKALDENGVPR